MGAGGAGSRGTSRSEVPEDSRKVKKESFPVWLFAFSITLAEPVSLWLLIAI